MTGLEKAIIVARWHGGKVSTFPVQYNPTELSLEKSVQLAEIAIPGLDSPLLQFVRGQNEQMTLELFFDTTEDGTGEGAVSVTTLTDRVYELAKIEPGGHAPPICTFIWNADFPGADVSANVGNQRRTHFQFVVQSVSQKFTLFSPEGVPLRARLSLTLREYKTLDQQLDQLNLSSPDRTHSHVTQEGETLSHVASQHYLRPGRWRPIAEANAIDDPRRLTPGLFLTIPPLS